MYSCATGAIWISELQLAGRKRTPPRDLAAGRSIAIGDILQTPEDALVR